MDSVVMLFELEEILNDCLCESVDELPTPAWW